MLEALRESPEALGLDPERLNALDALLQRGIEQGMFPAATYAVLRSGKIAAINALGFAQPDADPPLPATLDTIFDMASLTKPMAATLLLQCVENGQLHLGQSVHDFLPEAAQSPVGPVTLRQLATHTSGLPPWKPLYEAVSGGQISEILATPLEAEPGSRYAYSDLGYILLGEMLARVTDTPLDQLLRDRILTPLGMTRSGYRPDPSLRREIAATRNCPWRGKDEILIGEVHDANAHSLGGVSGHAGFFSTVPDMIRFALALRYPPRYAPLQEPPAFLQQQLFTHRSDSDLAATQHGLPMVLGLLATRLARESQIDPAIGGHTIGWFAPPNGMLPRGDLISAQSFGHTGFTGTSLIFDNANDLILLLLTNRVYSPNDGAAMIRLRRYVSNIAASALS